MRPDRPVVILDGIVAAFAFGHGSYAPPGEHLGAHQVVTKSDSLVIIDDAAPQQLADVGAKAVHLPLGAVESNGEEFPVRNPVVLVEPTFEISSLLFQLGGQRLILPYRARQAGAAQFSVVGVALDFTGGP